MDAVMTIIAGATVLTIVTIGSGGAFLLRTATDAEQTPLQRSMFRAGHAHAGVLVTLGLLCLVIQRTSGVDASWQFASVGVLASAILMPLGFFLSVLDPAAVRPNKWIRSTWIGAGVLTLSLIAVGVSVIVAGAAALSA